MSDVHQEKVRLSDTTCAQACEIRAGSQDGGVIRQTEIGGETVTIWAREADGSLGFEKIRHLGPDKYLLVQYASIRFTASGTVDNYTGSYTSAETGIRRILKRLFTTEAVQYQINDTVSGLVELVFRNLPDD